MRISTKVESGLIVMIDIALNSPDGEVVALYNISDRRNISIKYLEHIVTALRQKKIVKGIKGSRGGYVLARSAKEITIKEIVDAFDITVFGNEISEAGSDEIVQSVINRTIWDGIENYLNRYASSITLYELAEAYKKEISDRPDNFMYYI